MAEADIPDIPIKEAAAIFIKCFMVISFQKFLIFMLSNNISDKHLFQSTHCISFCVVGDVHHTDLNVKKHHFSVNLIYLKNTYIKYKYILYNYCK